MRVVFLGMFLNLCSAPIADAQKFYDVIADDSVKLYCNTDYSFTSSTCPDFIRFVKMNESGAFNGGFVDVRAEDSIIIATGHYKLGQKDGHFEIFYPDGSVHTIGQYADNNATGDWYFFYPNGIPALHLKMTGSDTLVVQQATDKGDIQVQAGEGMFDGPVGVKNFSGLWARGEIKEGKRTGSWSSYFPGQKNTAKIKYGTEEFKNGVLISGSYLAANHTKVEYTKWSFCSLFRPPPLIGLEKFNFMPCSTVSRPTEHASLISQTLFNAVMNNVFRTKNYFGIGNNNERVTINFTVDKNGVPKDFVMPNQFAPSLFSAITSALRARVRWKPAIRNKVAVDSRAFLNLDYVDTGSGFRYRYSLGHQ